MTSKRNIVFTLLIGLLVLVATLSVTNAIAEVPGDIRYERQANESADGAAELTAFPPTLFPHWIHRINYRCDACHDDLFEMKRGGTPVTMELINDGKACGACHNDQIAFASSFQTCHKCHVKNEQ